jgi:acyl-coenzyme A thioesterase PaaI-like protein
MSLTDILKKFEKNVKITKFLINFYPPFLFSGIRIREISKDYRYFKVETKLTWYNRNYVGTQFGGTLFSMTDPFYMLMLINNLGKGYIVWDKSSTIEFIKPGTTSVFAEFKLNEKILEEIKKETLKNGKQFVDFEIDIYDIKKDIVAKVYKTIYVKKV